HAMHWNMRTVVRWSVALKARVKSRGIFGHFQRLSEQYHAIVSKPSPTPLCLRSQETQITGELHPAQLTGDTAAYVLAEQCIQLLRVDSLASSLDDAVNLLFLTERDQ